MNISGSNIPDIKLVENTLDDIKIQIVGSRLAGDKGYVSFKLKQELLEKRQLRLIFPKKRNQKEEISEEDIKILKKRYIVENVFSWIKNYRRIRNRYEHNIENYIGFCYLSIIETIANKFS